MGNLTIDDAADIICQQWGLVSEGQKQLLKSKMIIAEYKKGEVFYNENGHPENLIFLLSGKVKIHKEGIGHRSQIVRVIKPDGMFGFRAFFAGQEYETAATAFEDSTAALIPLDVIRELIKNNSSVGYYFVKDLCVKLGDADVRTISLTQKHIRGRLAESLLYLKDWYGVEDDGCTLASHLSREEMANMSNMTTSNAIRTLSSFAEEHLIDIKGRKLKLIDEKGLRDISKRG